jgi:hypothetical protein
MAIKWRFSHDKEAAQTDRQRNASWYLRGPSTFLGSTRGLLSLTPPSRKRGWIPGCHNLRCCTRYLSMRSSNSPCHAALILAPFPGIHVGAELKHTHAVHLAARDCRAQRLPSAPVLVATRPRSTAACTTSLRTRDHSSKRQPPAAASPALAVPNRTFAQCRHCSSAAPAMPTSKRQLNRSRPCPVREFSFAWPRNVLASGGGRPRYIAHCTVVP